MGEVHPLLDTILGKEVPIAVVGRGKALKCFIDQLRGLDSCDGRQWLSTTTYDKTTGTPKALPMDGYTTSLCSFSP